MLAILLLVPVAARAQFYDVDGAYRCITAPDAGCTTALGTPPPPPPVSKDEVAAASKTSMADAIARVRHGQASAEDFRRIEAGAAAKDPRAVEVLAWCKLNGIGMAADAPGAYWLYREAAELGVANARQNQIAVFEARLNSTERQQVLLKENDPGR
jgi:hypothetical protein